MLKITKTVQESGNGGHIYLPKELIGKQVLVVQITRTVKDIKREILQILEPHLEHIIGVYLYGSYSRGEQKSTSDIDILVVTDKKLKIKEKMGDYEITSTTIEEIKKSLEHNAVIVLSIIKEAIAVLNGKLLKTFSNYKLNRKNTKWYLNSTKSSLNIIDNLMQDRLKSSIPNITYPLMTRLRGLYLIKCLNNNKEYSNKKLKEYLTKKRLKEKVIDDLYNVYQAARDEKRIPENKIDYIILERLYNIVKKLLLEMEKYG